MVASAEGLSRGAYTLAEFGDAEADMILIASGSEVDLVYQAGQRLSEDGFSCRVVSFPSWDLFESQAEAYRESVFPKRLTLRLAVEAGVRQGWDRYVGPRGQVIGIEHYGASAPYKTIMEYFGFTAANVHTHARALLESGGVKPRGRK
jgi:transketolase